MTSAEMTRSTKALIVTSALTVCLLVGSALTGAAQSAAADPRVERIADSIVAGMKARGIPGVALAISLNGERHLRGFGVTSVENPLPVTQSTFFQIGSITKTFTGTALLRLAEQGRVDLDAPIRTYLPTFRVADSVASERTTIRTLLTHVGGWEGDLFDDLGNGNDALAGIVDEMATLPQIAPFGTFWSYNNAGFYVAGRIIEVVTGKPYEDALAELVLGPLGLRQTHAQASDVMTYRFAVGHAGPPTRPIVLRPWTLPRAMTPAGGLIANATDLLNYGEFHLDGIAADGSRVLTVASLRRMWETQIGKQTPNEEMALTWNVSTVGDVRVLWHDGFAVGQAAALLAVPSKRLVVAVLTNSVHGERLNRDLRRAIVREYLGVNHVDPTPVAIPTADLARYTGRYSRPFMDVIVTVVGDRLMIQQVQKLGFPLRSGPVPPPMPAVPFKFYAPDQVIGVGPAQGDRMEFLRRTDGTVGWVRANGRLAKRVVVVNTGR